MAESTHKRGPNPCRLAHHLDHARSRQEFLPQNLQLQFGEPVADTTVNAVTERQMLARPLPIDDKAISLRNGGLITVPRQIPHGQFVAPSDLLAAQFGI